MPLFREGRRTASLAAFIASRTEHSIVFRETCLKCRRPVDSCLCPAEPPMKVLTKIVLLMHPKEARRERCGTGRLSCLHIAEAEIITGVDFDSHPHVRRLIEDPENYPVLLYPGRESIDLSTLEGAAFLGSETKGRRIVAFLVDATWSCSRTVLKQNPRLMTLPKLMFTPKVLSRWIIKRQPGPLCLSTIETVHELLCALENIGLEHYPDKARLLEAFTSMQEYHIARAVANGIPRYKQKAPDSTSDSIALS